MVWPYQDRLRNITLILSLLAAVKAQFEEILSIHVYSLSPSRINASWQCPLPTCTMSD